jgi:hypothetical protein
LIKSEISKNVSLQIYLSQDIPDQIGRKNTPELLIFGCQILCLSLLNPVIDIWGVMNLFYFCPKMHWMKTIIHGCLKEYYWSRRPKKVLKWFLLTEDSSNSFIIEKWKYKILKISWKIDFISLEKWSLQFDSFIPNLRNQWNV